MGILGPYYAELSRAEGEPLVGGSGVERIVVGLVKGGIALAKRGEMAPAEILGAAKGEVYVDVSAVHLQLLLPAWHEGGIVYVDEEVIALQGDAPCRSGEQIVGLHILKQRCSA